MSTDTVTTMPFMIKWSMGVFGMLVIMFLSVDMAFDILFLGVNQDSVVLTDTELATPLAVAKRYYGTDVNPVDGIITTGSLQQWWIAMRNYIWQQRKDGSMTPTGAFVALGKYMDSCMESHRWVDVRYVCVWMVCDLSVVLCYQGNGAIWCLQEREDQAVSGHLGQVCLCLWFGLVGDEIPDFKISNQS